MPTLLQLGAVLAKVGIAAPAAYLYLLALAAIRGHRTQPSRLARHRFAIAIPAHNEAAVIAASVNRLRQLDYPASLFDVHVVADHCTDATAELARAAGAIAHERSAEPRGSKGAALRWLFSRVLDDARPHAARYDAVVVFDADTHVAPDFLQIMDARLDQGDDVIQGQHVIRNPEDGWFPALAWAMFLIDNRIQNFGRASLGWSAKNMGDSICFRTEVLRQFGWGEGLTEDYAFRQRLLLAGFKIAYEPAARGYGEAPLSWATARTQRTRWLRGTRDASNEYARVLLVEGLKRRNLPLLDGALQAHLPSYSTLTLLTGLGWLASLFIGFVSSTRTAGERPALGNSWAAMGAALFAYPLLGLALERAPLRAYIAILLGPGFVIWRTWLAFTARFGSRQVVWVRTERKLERAARVREQS